MAAPPQILPLDLFAAGEPALGTDPTLVRHHLDSCSWVDVADRAVEGADTLFAELETGLDWHRRQRLMYGTWYDEPRLSATCSLDDPTLPAVIGDLRSWLSAHYQRSFEGLFCNFYRSGADSVAWHADRIGRTDIDPLVAIVSLGGPRVFAIRPFDVGAAVRFTLHSGDVLVMGGATQHHWQHAIPKCAEAPPRMSLTMRAGGPPFSSQVSEGARRRHARRRPGDRPAPHR